MIIKLLRIKHWSKNLVIFAPLIFAGAFNAESILNSIIAFLAMSFMASAVYIINDIIDRDIDATNPYKKDRPIASGRIGIKLAKNIAAFFYILSLLISYIFLDIRICICILVYYFINRFYSAYIKHVVILDVMFIALGFALRVLIGGYSAAVPVTDWLLVMTFFISMLMGFGKRKGEMSLDCGYITKRSVLMSYKSSILDGFIMASGVITLIAYSMYTLDPNVIAKFNALHLFYTIPIVAYGIFRYILIVFEYTELNRDTDPSYIIFHESSIYLTVIIWLLAICSIIYLHL